MILLSERYVFPYSLLIASHCLSHLFTFLSDEIQFLFFSRFLSPSSSYWLHPFEPSARYLVYVLRTPFSFFSLFFRSLIFLFFFSLLIAAFNFIPGDGIRIFPPLGVADRRTFTVG